VTGYPPHNVIGGASAHIQPRAGNQIFDIGGGGIEYNQPLRKTNQFRGFQRMFGHPGRVNQGGRGSRGVPVVYGHFALRLPNVPFFAKL
jgi:hypothetical protein